jgi:hypothetical protein
MHPEEYLTGIDRKLPPISLAMHHAAIVKVTFLPSTSPWPSSFVCNVPFDDSLLIIWTTTVPPDIRSFKRVHISVSALKTLSFILLSIPVSTFKALSFALNLADTFTSLLTDGFGEVYKCENVFLWHYQYKFEARVIRLT